MSELTEAVAALTAEHASAPLQVVNLSVVEDGPRPRVTGAVLTFSQARAVRALGSTHGADVDVVVAADPASGAEVGFVEGVGDTIAVWRDPQQVGAGRSLQTEYLRSDPPLRVLGERDEALLVQGADLAMGWVERSHVRDADPSTGRAAWQGILRAEEGTAVLPDPARLAPRSAEGGEELRADLLRAARSFLGLPYLWGGTTRAGVDCSGLVQRAFLDATGILLPRHSAEQRRCGLRVTAGHAEPGDLLFATPRNQRVGHVLLVSSTATVIHACRTEGRVIEESMADNAARYVHQGYRRPVLLK